MEKFLIVDGNSILNRAFYGLAGAKMTTTDGIHTNAIFGFLNIYYMICEKFSPDYIAVAFDLKAPTFRHKMYEEYKGTRKGMPDELKEQVPIIKDVLKAMNIHIFELEGYEADDILGTIASLNEKNTQKDIFTYILTGDRDSYQLISNKTSIIFPSSKMGKTDYTVYTPELLKEEKGIEPYQIVDIKALMGDSSDNIPGVKGIGEKTAYTLIHKYTTLDNIYKNIATLDASPKIIEKLKNDEKMARLSYTLATINREVPINLNYEENKVCDVNKEELFKLFKKLSFNKFLTKYNFDDISSNENLSQSAKINIKRENIILINKSNFNQYNKILDELFNYNKIAYILNINDDNQAFNNILNISDRNFLALYSDKDNKCYIINFDSLKQDKNLIKNILLKFSNSNCEKLGYNIKQDIRFIFTNICDNVNNFNYDLLIACYLLDSTRNYKFKRI